MAILEDLLKALQENTEVTKNLIALRTEAIETVKSAAATTAKPKGEPKADTTATTTTTTTTAAASSIDAAVYGKIAEAIGAYVGGSEREDERTARKLKIKALLQHDAIKKPGTPADQFSPENIKDDAIQVFNDNLAALVAKGDLTEAPKASLSLV